MLTKTKQSVGTQNLPKFEGTISFEIEVEQIHQMLLKTFPEDYKHKELLAHAIIGTSANLGFVYNALAGFTNDIDFQVGDTVICTEKVRRYNWQAKGEDQSVTIKSEKQEVGTCEVTAINLYAYEKLRVKFTQHSYNSMKTEETEVWVSHKNCTKWDVEAVAH